MLTAADEGTSAGEDPADWGFDPEAVSGADASGASGASDETVGTLMHGTMGAQFACLIGP